MVKSDPNAIGYVSLDFTGGLHTIPYKGVACTLRNAKSGQYGGVRNLYMVTRGAANGTGQDVDQLDPQQQRGAVDHRHRVGSAALVSAGALASERTAEGPRPTGAPSLPLGALASAVLLLIAGMIVFVFAKAWPSFSHNGLAWFGPGGNVDEQLDDIFNSPADPNDYVYTLHAWPLLYATALITGAAVLLAIGVSLLSAIFIVEFAPRLDPPRARAGGAAAGRRAVGRSTG